MTVFRRGISLVRTYGFPLQLLCLLMAVGLEFLMVTVGNMFGYAAYILLHKCILIPCLLFWAVTFVRNAGQRPRYGLGLAMITVLWFLIAELQHRTAGLEGHTLGLFFSVYLLAFPFAGVTEDGDRQWGIKLMLALFMLASGVLLVYSGLLMADAVPGFLQEHLFWDGARLNAVTHPNISSRVFLIGITGCLCFLGDVKKKWQKGLLMAAIVPMFAALSLTNSRGTVLVACLILGGTAFFSVFRGSLKQFLAGGAIGLVLLAVLFVSSQELYQWNRDRLVRQVTVQQTEVQKEEKAKPAKSTKTETEEEKQARQALDTVNPQGSLVKDMGTLNSRTKIWKAILKGLKKEPSVLLWGTDGVDAIMNRRGDHAHNAWMETLVRLGVPGLLMSLVFTAQAVWSGICLLWYPRISLEKKILAMLVAAFLVSGVLEPFLFFTEDSWHFVDFAFFLCLGYLNRWRLAERSLRKENA